MLYNIFIGYDYKESAAYHTLCQSIIDHSSQPVAITPLNLKNLGGLYQREYDRRQSNSFSFSRFLVPYLMGHRGQAIFMDCDMLVTRDIVEVFKECSDANKAVHVVQHDYQSKVTEKYLGNKQYSYPRKNWSSFVHWNCEHPKNSVVNPEFVASESAAHLHRFLWLEDSEIGSIDVSWNFLVGEYDKPSSVPANIHWTLGGPYFREYQDADYADIWQEKFKRMTYTEQKNENMK